MHLWMGLLFNFISLANEVDLWPSRVTCCVSRGWLRLTGSNKGGRNEKVQISILQSNIEGRKSHFLNWFYLFNVWLYAGWEKKLLFLCLHLKEPTQWSYNAAQRCRSIKPVDHWTPFLLPVAVSLMHPRAPQQRRWRGCPSSASFWGDSAGTRMSLLMVSAPWGKTLTLHSGIADGSCLFTSMSHSDAYNLCKRGVILQQKCLAVCSYGQKAAAAVSVGTVLGASRQCCGKNS